MNEFLEDAAAFFAASRQKSGKNKDWCILQSGQMTAETPEKSVFTAIRCKSADSSFTIILGVRASHGSISRLLTLCGKFMMRTRKMLITAEYVCIRHLSTEKKSASCIFRRFLIAMTWCQMVLSWQIIRICSAIGGIPPAVKRRRLYSALTIAA